MMPYDKYKTAKITEDANPDHVDSEYQGQFVSIVWQINDDIILVRTQDDKLHYIHIDYLERFCL